LKNINLLFYPVIFFILIIHTISATSHASSNEILIHIRDDVYTDYQNFVGDRDVLTIKSFSGKTIRRDVVDMIIAQQALQLGGFSYEFIYSPGKVNFRNTKMLQKGELLISFDSYWKSDAKVLADELYISEPVIRDGEYVAGIYTSPNNLKVLQIERLADFKKLTSISTPKWRTDWKTLENLSLKELVTEDSWLSMVRMVNLQWIDFMLMPFNATPDRSFTLDKIHLVPVPNFAIVLKDSRHFVISKAHPQGRAAFIAINKGLKILRKYGTITKAYTEAGFVVDPIQYTILNL
jgi:hypothetical protein